MCETLCDSINTRTHVLSLSRTFRHALIAILFLMATSSVIAQQVIIEKIPIIYAALGGVGYFVYDYYTNMTAFKNEYLHRVNGGTPQLKGYTNYPNSSIYNLYQSNNKNFQLFVIISAAVYGLNLIDAYVFGHLYDFQVNDDLSLNLSPSFTPDFTNPTGLTPTLQMTFRF